MNNPFGQPIRVYKFFTIPENITLEDVDEGTNLSNVEQEISMAYDESGNRIWYNVEDADGSGPIFKKNGNNPFISLFLEMGRRWATRRLGSARRSA